MGEHLYRDEVGAAVERLTQLEEENARLRAELERLTAPKQAGIRHARGSAALMLFLAAALTGSGLAVRSPCPHSRAARATAAQRSELQEIRGGNDCSIPYWYDSNGVKRVKTACITPARR